MITIRLLAVGAHRLADGRAGTAFTVVEYLIGHYAGGRPALRNTPRFADEIFTRADVMMAFPLMTLQGFRPVSLAGHPTIRAWVAQIAQGPA